MSFNNYKNNKLDKITLKSYRKIFAIQRWETENLLSDCLWYLYSTKVDVGKDPKTSYKIKTKSELQCPPGCKEAHH